jgi:5-methylcytosine-specific restriction endonuclease McrA
LGKFQKGHIPWHKGKKTGLVPRSAFKKGFKMSEETKQKIHDTMVKKGIKPKTTGAKRIWTDASRKKVSDAQKGKKHPDFSKENHWNWQGGKTPENHRIRMCLETKMWRRACFERDNFTCQKTGQRGGRLVVHHINNFADFPELRTAIDNGITLSKEAHIKFHHIYGIRNNTKEQLLEFLSTKE